MNETQATSGTLYIVATPIGNLEDITLRALRILKEADCIAAEDTRHTQKLLNHYGISSQLISYYREREQQRAEELIAMLREGKSIALVTDAGTPAISDPGAVIVRKCLEWGLHVVPIPGASALTSALSCAGIDSGAICFYGFAPSRQGQRRKLFQSLYYAESHSVFYESPRRIRDFILDAYEVLHDRPVFLGRELTKTYEELTRSTLQQLAEAPESLSEKGEYVVIIAPAESSKPAEMDLDEQIRWYRDNTELSVKDCSKAIAADLGLPKSDIYRRAIQLWEED